MRNRLINLVLLILFILLALNLFRSLKNFYLRRSMIKNAEDRLQAELNQNDNLKRELAKTQSESFVEKQARDELNLIKEGEIIVILPTISPFIEPSPTPIDTSSNFEKWWKVFF